MHEPRRSGFAVFHSTDLMLAYQAGTLSGSAVYAATTSRGRSITISVETSTSPAKLSRRDTRLELIRPVEDDVEMRGWRLFAALDHQQPFSIRRHVKIRP